MKKIIALLLVSASLSLSVTACRNEEPIVFHTIAGTYTVDRTFLIQTMFVDTQYHIGEDGFYYTAAITYIGPHDTMPIAYDPAFVVFSLHKDGEELAVFEYPDGTTQTVLTKDEPLECSVDPDAVAKWITTPGEYHLTAEISFIAGEDEGSAVYEHTTLTLYAA